MTVSIVLGAGGPVGWVFHMGVLAAVDEVLGVDVTTADRLIGTSAGAAIAGAKLSGSDDETIIAAMVARPSEAEMERMRTAMAEFRKPWRRFRPGAAGVVPKALRGGSATVTATAVVGLLPTGVFPTSSLRRFPAPDPEAAWPQQLWIPSVGLDDGQLMVFGRDRTDVAVADAMEASSAVPAMFQPKQIDGRRFVDGAVRSATNADLLIAAPTDVVVISAPMNRPGRGPVKIRARRQLAQEAKRLRANGATVVVIEPGADITERAEGFPRHNPERATSLIEQARQAALTELASAING